MIDFLLEDVKIILEGLTVVKDQMRLQMHGSLLDPTAEKIQKEDRRRRFDEDKCT